MRTFQLASNGVVGIIAESSAPKLIDYATI